MQKLSFLDLTFFLTESDATPQHVALLLVVKKPPNACKDYGKKLFEILKTYDVPKAPFNLVIKMIGIRGPHWEVTNNFNINEHLFYHHPAEPLNDAALRQYVAQLHEPKMNRNKPLWEVYLIDGLQGNRFAFYLKVHHAYMDGMSLFALLKNGLEKTSLSHKLTPFWASGQASKSIESSDQASFLIQLLKKTASLLVTLKAFVKMSTQAFLEFSGLTKNPHSLLYRASGNIPFPGSLTPQRQFTVACVSVERIKKLRKATKSKLNDMLLAGIDEGLHQYLKHTGIHLKKAVTIMMPINLRTKQSIDGGNEVGIIPVDLAKPEAAIPERIKEIGSALNNVRNQMSRLSDKALKQYALFAATLSGIVAFLKLSNYIMPPSNIIVTTLPSLKRPIYLKEGTLAAAKIEEIIPFGNLLAGIHLSIALFSYAGVLYFGINATKQVQQLELLSDYIEAAFVNLEEKMVVQ